MVFIGKHCAIILYMVPLKFPYKCHECFTLSTNDVESIIVTSESYFMMTSMWNNCTKALQ